ncbi:hypothetical protein N752_19465 [Desulforamulus aquiferis]|nr:hypothetical protein [Desulforamulus aquiferis]RYD03588.1 hypothetical protein N752_19465 [Desulforamulus aquiferis]
MDFLTLSLWSNLYQQRTGAYGIGKGQFLFLIVLYERDGLLQEEIAQCLNIDKALQPGH